MSQHAKRVEKENKMGILYLTFFKKGQRALGPTVSCKIFGTPGKNRYFDLNPRVIVD